MKIVWILLIGTAPLFAELSIQNIEKMVKDIRSKRQSKLDSNASSITSPFIAVQKDENRSVAVTIPEKAVRTNFVLSGIVNDTAFIDGQWKKVGDVIGDFHVETVQDDHVVLKRKNRTITLYFQKAKDILTLGKE